MKRVPPSVLISCSAADLPSPKAKNALDSPGGRVSIRGFERYRTRTNQPRTATIPLALVCERVGV